MLLGGRKTAALHCWVDADLAGCTETRLSTTGYVTFVYDSPVTWTSRRQQSVASSTTAAEYMAAAEAVQEVMWLRSLLVHLLWHPLVPLQPPYTLTTSRQLISVSSRSTSQRQSTSTSSTTSFENKSKRRPSTSYTSHPATKSPTASPSPCQVLHTSRHKPFFVCNFPRHLNSAHQHLRFATHSVHPRFRRGECWK